MNDQLPSDRYRVPPTWTLEDYVMHLFRSKATHSREFKAILEIFGRERIEEIWEKFKKEELQD